MACLLIYLFLLSSYGIEGCFPCSSGLPGCPCLYDQCGGRGTVVGRSPERVEVDRFGCPLPSRHVTGFPLSMHSRSGLLLCHRKRISRSEFASLPRCLPSKDLVVFGGAGIVRTHLRFQGRAKTLVRMFYLRPVRPGSCTLGFRRARRAT